MILKKTSMVWYKGPVCLASQFFWRAQFSKFCSNFENLINTQRWRIPGNYWCYVIKTQFIYHPLLQKQKTTPTISKLPTKVLLIAKIFSRKSYARHTRFLLFLFGCWFVFVIISESGSKKDKKQISWQPWHYK